MCKLPCCELSSLLPSGVRRARGVSLTPSAWATRARGVGSGGGSCAPRDLHPLDGRMHRVYGRQDSVRAEDRENELTQRTVDKRQKRNPGRRGKHRRNQNKHRARRAQNTGTSDTGAQQLETEKGGQGVAEHHTPPLPFDKYSLHHGIAVGAINSVLGVSVANRRLG